MRFNPNVRRFSQSLSMSTCTNQLKQNDPHFVELSLERFSPDDNEDHFDLEEFVLAMSCNRTVEHVCFSGTFVRELTHEQWSTILCSLSKLQSLQEVQIWSASIPLAILAQVIQHSLRLRKIYFFRVVFQGTAADMKLFANAIQQHKTLRDCRIGGFQLINTANQDQLVEIGNEEQAGPMITRFMNAAEINPDDVTTATTMDENMEMLSFDSVLEGMACCQSLRVVSLQLTGSSTHNIAPFTGLSLKKLLSSPFLEDVYLSRLCLQDDHYKAIAETLSCPNMNIRTLDLFGNCILDEHVVLIANELQYNESIEIFVLPCPTDDLSIESCQAISKTLYHNNKLHTWNLPRSSFDDRGIPYLTQGLITNRTMKKMEIGLSKEISIYGIHSLIDMFEKNYTLERFIVSGGPPTNKPPATATTTTADTNNSVVITTTNPDTKTITVGHNHHDMNTMKDKIDYYMKLNEVGRGRLLLLENPDHNRSYSDDSDDDDDTNVSSSVMYRDAWIEMLITVRNDLDCLYYFLLANPTLCQARNVKK